jgi:hypothetical protein
MKLDLQALTDHVGIKLSQYTREIVISHLLDHGTLPKHPEMIEAGPLSSAKEWCGGKLIPCVGSVGEVLERSRELRTEWVDDQRARLV